MYSIQTTPGFIIDSRAYGEAGKMLFIFTRDLGLVMAVAQGIRFERSKLRPFTQDYSFGEFSFVRGKEMWRLTSAQEFDESGELGEYHFPLSGKIACSNCNRIMACQRRQDTGNCSRLESHYLTRENDIHRARLRSELIARVASLLRRFLRGEEAHPELFECVRACGVFLASDEGDLTSEQMETLESLIVIRILHNLGYVGDVSGLNGEVSSNEISLSLLDGLKQHRVAMNRHINKALKESHL